MKTNKYIEDYFNNNLTEEDRSSFEEQLKVDEAFAREVKDHALLINAFDEVQAEELSNRFSVLEQEIHGVSEKRINFPIYMKLAATVILLAVLSLLVFLANNSSSEEGLFLAYYTPYPNVESPVSRSELSRQDAWSFYEQGNYAEAAKLFKRQIAKQDTALPSWFYLGICELEQNRIKEAKIAFTNVLKQKGSKYFEQAQWYMALCYLYDGKTIKTKTMLEEIITAGGGFDAKAKELLEKMN